MPMALDTARGLEGQGDKEQERTLEPQACCLLGIPGPGVHWEL